MTYEQVPEQLAEEPVVQDFEQEKQVEDDNILIEQDTDPEKQVEQVEQVEVATAIQVFTFYWYLKNQTVWEKQCRLKKQLVQLLNDGQMSEWWFTSS